jgi:hypothetical protein
MTPIAFLPPAADGSLSLPPLVVHMRAAPRGRTHCVACHAPRRSLRESCHAQAFIQRLPGARVLIVQDQPEFAKLTDVDLSREPPVVMSVETDFPPWFNYIYANVSADGTSLIIAGTSQGGYPPETYVRSALAWIIGLFRSACARDARYPPAPLADHAHTVSAARAGSHLGILAQPDDLPGEFHNRSGCVQRQQVMRSGWGAMRVCAGRLLSLICAMHVDTH